MKNDDFTVTKVAFAYYKEMAGGHFIAMRKRAHNGLTLVLSGRLKLTFDDGSSVSADAGSIILQRAGDSYRLEATDKLGTEYIVISYIAEPTEAISELLSERIFTGVHFRRYRDAFEEAARVYASTEICQSALLRALVQEILCTVIHESYHGSLMKTADPAASVKYHIDEYFDRCITADDLATVSGISASHLRFLFKRAYGEAPMHYLNRVRIEHAKEMLSSGMFTQEEVAAACGFQNVYYFNSVFKRFTGTPPGKY